jgi:hypothetical protein
VQWSRANREPSIFSPVIEHPRQRRHARASCNRIVLQPKIVSSIADDFASYSLMMKELLSQRRSTANGFIFSPRGSTTASVGAAR